MVVLPAPGELEFNGENEIKDFVDDLNCSIERPFVPLLTTSTSSRLWMTINSKWICFSRRRSFISQNREHTRDAQTWCHLWVSLLEDEKVHDRNHFLEIAFDLGSDRGPSKSDSAESCGQECVTKRQSHDQLGCHRHLHLLA